MSKSRGSPRKFAEKIALLNKKEAEANAEFEKIIKEVEETTRVSPIPGYPSSAAGYVQISCHKATPLPLPPQAASTNTNHESTGWFQSESTHYIETIQQHATNFGAPVSPPEPTYHQLVNHQPHHYSNCHPQQHNHQHQHQHQHNTTLVPPQDILLEDSLSPPSMATTNPSIPNIKVHLTSDDNSGYQQAQQTLSPRQSPQPNHHQQNQLQHHHLQHMTCFGSSPITVARSLPDIANLRVSTSSSTTMAPSYSDHQLPAADDYNYDYDYDANSNIVQTSNSPNYCSDNNNAPQLDLVSCQQSNTTSAADYNNYVPPPTTLNSMHHPNHTTTANNYYPPATNQHHQHFSNTTNQLGTMNRANSTSIVHQQSNNKLPNCDEDFLTEPRVSNGLSRSTEACYELTRPFGYDTYGTRTPLSQYGAESSGGCGGPRKLRSSSYNNLETINSHQPSPAQHYTQQQSIAEHNFVPSQQFYN